MRLSSKLVLFLVLSIPWLTLTPYETEASQCTKEEMAKMSSGGMSPKRVAEICGTAGSANSISTTALATLKTLAEQGNAEAAFELGMRYEKGEGIIRDYVQAYAWYARSYAKSGSSKHKAALDAIESKMQPADIEKAQKLSKGNTSKSSPRIPQQPKCTKENVVRWNPTQMTLKFDGSSDELGWPSKSYACNLAQKNAHSTFESATDECELKFGSSRFRNVTGTEVPGGCECEDNRDIGLGFSCDYKFSVQCKAEERVTDIVENCF